MPMHLLCPGSAAGRTRVLSLPKRSIDWWAREETSSLDARFLLSPRKKAESLGVGREELQRVKRDPAQARPPPRLPPVKQQSRGEGFGAAAQRSPEGWQSLAHNVEEERGTGLAAGSNGHSPPGCPPLPGPEMPRRGCVQAHFGTRTCSPSNRGQPGVFRGRGHSCQADQATWGADVPAPHTLLSNQ